MFPTAVRNDPRRSVVSRGYAGGVALSGAAASASQLNTTLALFMDLRCALLETSDDLRHLEVLQPTLGLCERVRRAPAAGTKLSAEPESSKYRETLSPHPPESPASRCVSRPTAPPDESSSSSTLRTSVDPHYSAYDMFYDMASAESKATEGPQAASSVADTLQQDPGTLSSEADESEFLPMSAVPMQKVDPAKRPLRPAHFLPPLVGANKRRATLAGSSARASASDSADMSTHGSDAAMSTTSVPRGHVTAKPLPRRSSALSPLVLCARPDSQETANPSCPSAGASPGVPLSSSSAGSRPSFGEREASDTMRSVTARSSSEDLQRAYKDAGAGSIAAVADDALTFVHATRAQDRCRWEVSDLVHDATAGAVSLGDEECAARGRLELMLVEVLEQTNRCSVENAYARFVRFSAEHEPLWRSAANALAKRKAEHLDSTECVYARFMLAECCASEKVTLMQEATDFMTSLKLMEADEMSLALSRARQRRRDSVIVRPAAQERTVISTSRQLQQQDSAVPVAAPPPAPEAVRSQARASRRPRTVVPPSALSATESVPRRIFTSDGRGWSYTEQLTPPERPPLSKSDPPHNSPASRSLGETVGRANARGRAAGPGTVSAVQGGSGLPPTGGEGGVPILGTVAGNGRGYTGAASGPATGQVVLQPSPPALSPRPDTAAPRGVTTPVQQLPRAQVTASRRTQPSHAIHSSEESKSGRSKRSARAGDKTAKKK